jgi:hypothetical protein
MSKFLALFVASVWALLTFSTPALAQENMRSGEAATLSANETINKDFFTAGNNVHISGVVNGDAYAGGGTVSFDGVVNGDLLVGGGNVHITGKVNNLRVAGGNVIIDGTVTGNITAVGGDIVIEKDSKIAGSLAAAGGNITVYSPIGKGITAAAGSLGVSSNVGGDVVAIGSKFNLSSGASVLGDLTYYSQNAPAIAPEATVSGKITHNLPPKKQPNPNAQKAAAFFNTGWLIFNFLSSLVVGLIALLLGPKIIRQKGETILQKPWQSLGIGVLVAVLMPFIIFALVLTIIGIPIAIGLFIFYLLLLFYIKIFISIAIGIKTFEILGRKVNIYWAFITGLIIYSLITVVPVLGWLVSLIGVLMGLGAYVITDYSLYQLLRSKKQI